MTPHRYTWTQMILAGVVVVAGFLINWLFEMSALLLLALYVWLPPLRRFTYFPVVGQLSGLASFMTVGLLAVGVGTAGIALYPPQRAAPIPGPTVAIPPSTGSAPVALPSDSPSQSPSLSPTPSPTPTLAPLATPFRPIAAVGDRAQIRPDGPAAYVFVAYSVANYDELLKVLRVKDELGVVQMAREGKAGMIERGTSVLVLDSSCAGTFCSDVILRVRILSGYSTGEAVWIDRQEVVR